MVDMIEVEGENSISAETSSNTDNAVVQESQLTDHLDSSKLKFIVNILGDNPFAQQPLLLQVNGQVSNMVEAFAEHKKRKWEEQYKKNNPDFLTETVKIDGEDVPRIHHEYIMKHADINSQISKEKHRQELTKITSATKVYDMKFTRHVWPYCTTCVRYKWNGYWKPYHLMDGYLHGRSDVLKMSCGELDEFRRMTYPADWILPLVECDIKNNEDHLGIINGRTNISRIKACPNQYAKLIEKEMGDNWHQAPFWYRDIGVYLAHLCMFIAFAWFYFARRKYVDSRKMYEGDFDSFRQYGKVEQNPDISPKSKLIGVEMSGLSIDGEKRTRPLE